VSRNPEGEEITSAFMGNSGNHSTGVSQKTGFHQGAGIGDRTSAWWDPAGDGKGNNACFPRTADTGPQAGLTPTGNDSPGNPGRRAVARESISIFNDISIFTLLLLAWGWRGLLKATESSGRQ